MNAMKKFVNDIIKYKEYVIYSVRADLMLNLSGRYLGYIWWILDPVMYMLVYVVVVSFVFDRGEPNYPVFVFSALLIWKWVSQSINRNTNSIKSKSGILKQIYIPKAILPLIQVVVSSVYFMFGIVALLIILPFFGVGFTWHIIEFVVVFVVTFMLILGIGLNVAHLGVYFKDINNILAFGLRLWFYLSPGLYSIDRIPEAYRILWWLNPMTTIYRSSRNVLMHGTSPVYNMLALWFAIALLLIVYGINRLDINDRNYTKVI